MAEWKHAYDVREDTWTANGSRAWVVRLFNDGTFGLEPLHTSPVALPTLREIQAYCQSEEEKA